jgi:sec-independent protein translocase protein TatA
MGALSIWHVILVLLVVLVMFGAGKLPSVMGDMAKGVKAFKRGMAEDPVDTTAKDNSKEIPHNNV